MNGALKTKQSRIRKTMIIDDLSSLMIDSDLPAQSVKVKKRLLFICKLHLYYLDSCCVYELFQFLGGAISSLVHLNLIKEFKLHDEDNLQQTELINITFGSPLFGNFVLEADLENKGYLKNMYHFASTTDVVPAVLSIGHTFKIIKGSVALL